MDDHTDHNRDIGRLEAQVEALFGAITRIESKLDVSLTQHDERLRDVEGEIKALRRLGTVVAALWTTIVGTVVWWFRPTP